MAGVSCIFRKELSDAASNKAFLISCAVLLISCAFTGVSAANSYSYLQLTMTVMNQPGLNPELVIMRELVPQIQLVGALVAAAYGFNAINKERAEGNLKILLSYPIYRDQVILGKLMASLLLITFTTFLSMIVSLTLYLFSTNIVFSPDQYSRYLVFMCLSTLLLTGYLGVSMFLSIAFNDPKASLIVIFLLISVFNSYVFYSYGRIVTDTVYGPEFDRTMFYSSTNPSIRALREAILYLSPAFGLKKIVDLLDSNRFLIFVGSEPTWMESDLWRVLISRVDAIAVLAIIPVLSFSASYVYFTRREIT